MQCDAIKPYYEVLAKKKASLVLKRCFDVVVAGILLVLLLIPMSILALCIRLDSEGASFLQTGAHYHVWKEV